MPPAIGAVIVGAFGLSATTTVLGVELGTIVGYAVLGTATLGLGLLLQSGQKQKSSSEQLTVKQALPTRVRVYGRTKLGGALFFMETAAYSTLVQGFIHCEGPIDAYESWWLNDVETNLAANTFGGVNTADPWVGWVSIESHAGTTDQTASLDLTTLFPGQWTGAHQLKGLAYSVLTCAVPTDPIKNFQRIFPNGAPAPRVVVRGSKVYDPRDGVTRWSSNPACCILDFLTTPRGFALPMSLMDLASFAAFANVCDGGVDTVSQGTIPRYSLGGTYDLTEEPKAVLQRMLDTCDGDLVSLPDGTIGIRGGIWEEPTVTLTDDMVLGYQYQQANDRLSAYNQLKITYTEPGSDFQQVEGTPWDDETDQALQGVLIQDFPLPMVPYHSQARRLAKIKMARDNPRHKLTLTTGIAGLAAIGERIITVRIAELGIATSFAVTSFEPSADLSTCKIGVSSLEAVVYDWNAAVEESSSPPYAVTEPTAATAPAPTGVAVEGVLVAIASGATAVRVRATAAEPTDPSAAYWVLAGRFRIVGATAWTAMVADGDDAVLSDFLEDGSDYEIQVAFRGLGTRSAWLAAGTFHAVADPVAPASPSGLGVTLSGATATVTWTNPGSADFSTAKVYRGATSSFAAATRIATVAGAPSGGGTEADAGLAAGTYYYFVTAANHSGVESPAIGPVSVTV